MREASMETIQGYFNALDTNKWLLANAMNKEQEARARRFEANVMAILNDLIAPLPIVD